MRKCMMRAEYLMKKGISQDFLAAMTDYITCYEKEGYNCDKKMMRDYVNINYESLSEASGGKTWGIWKDGQQDRTDQDLVKITRWSFM